MDLHTERITRADVALVLGLIAVLLVDALTCPHGNVSWLGAGPLLVVTVPLLWRSVAPRTVLGIVMFGVVLCLLTLKPTNTVVLPGVVAIFAVARHSDRTGSVVLALISVPFAMACVVIFSDDAVRLLDLLFNGSMLLLGIATGDAVRSRSAYRATAAERAAEQERERHAEALRMVAEERLRIARDVHDVIAHAMVAINVQAGVAAHVLDRRPEQAREALKQIKATSGSALSDLRTTLGLLREDGADAPVRPTECLAEIPELAGALRAAGVEVEFAVEGLPEAVPAPIGAASYRIVQEASTNILRHAGARRASIRVAIGRDSVELEVADDGAALAPVGGSVATGTGSGLRGMTERATTLGGRLDAGRGEDGGWRVHAVLPLR